MQYKRTTVDNMSEINVICKVNAYAKIRLGRCLQPEDQEKDEELKNISNLKYRVMRICY